MSWFKRESYINSMNEILSSLLKMYRNTERNIHGVEELIPMIETRENFDPFYLGKLNSKST